MLLPEVHQRRPDDARREKTQGLGDLPVLRHPQGFSRDYDKQLYQCQALVRQADRNVLVRLGAQ